MNDKSTRVRTTRKGSVEKSLVVTIIKLCWNLPCLVFWLDNEQWHFRRCICCSAIG